MSSSSLIFSHLPPIKSLKKLNCPDCAIGMNAFSCNNEIVFKCYSCDGVWFNKGTFTNFKNTLDQLDLSKIEKIYKPDREDAIEISACPKCRTPLDEEPYSYKTDVNIRKCSRCQGFWFKIYDLLTLIQNSKFSQSIQEDAKVLASETSNFIKLKHNLNNKVSMLGFYGRNKKYVFLLTPFALIGIVLMPVFLLIQFVYRKLMKN